MEKKKRLRIPMENKVRAVLQQEVDSMCPFCGNTEVGHFEIHHIDEDPGNNDQANLILLCPICHSKITKGEISRLETMAKKISLLLNSAKSRLPARGDIHFNAAIANAIVGDNNTISIKQNKSVKQKYPPGCIGSEIVMTNYVSHLIQRFNEYKEYELGKGKVHYAVFSSLLKKQFKIGPTRSLYHLPEGKFADLVSYIQFRIDGTKLARIKGKAHKNYSTFEEYEKGHG